MPTSSESSPAGGPPSLIVPGMPSDFGTVLSFVRAPLDVVANDYFAWQNGPVVGSHLLRQDFEGGLAEHAMKLLPLRYHFYDHLLVGTANGEWTAFFGGDDFRNHPDPGASAMGWDLSVDIVEVWVKPYGDANTDPRNDPDFLTSGYGRQGSGLTALEYNGPGAEGSWVRRRITMYEHYTKSARRKFVLKGDAQAWEEQAHYRLRKIGERFTPEILESYCRNLGIDVFNLDFYSGPVVFGKRVPPESAE